MRSNLFLAATAFVALSASSVVAGPVTTPIHPLPHVPPVVVRPPIHLPPVVVRPPIHLPPVVVRPPIHLPPVVVRPPIHLPPVVVRPPIHPLPPVHPLPPPHQPPHWPTPPHQPPHWPTPPHHPPHWPTPPHHPPHHPRPWPGPIFVPVPVPVPAPFPVPAPIDPGPVTPTPVPAPQAEAFPGANVFADTQAFRELVAEARTMPEVTQRAFSDAMVRFVRSVTDELQRAGITDRLGAGELNLSAYDVVENQGLSLQGTFVRGATTAAFRGLANIAQPQNSTAEVGQNNPGDTDESSR